MKGLVRIFVSYAREDAKARDSLLKVLTTLGRTHPIEPFHDGKINPGKPWGEEILDCLSTADIVLMLLSDDFFNSEYCYEKEWPIARERYRNGDVVIVPIIIRPVA